MTRPSERACCRRGGARQTKRSAQSCAHYARGLNIRGHGVSGGWPLCACVQLAELRGSTIVRCFSSILSIRTVGGVHAPRDTEWSRHHAPTRPRPRDDRTTPHLPHSAFDSPTGVQLRGPECTPPCSCYRMKACIALTHGNSSGMTVKKSNCMLSQPLRLSS